MALIVGELVAGISADASSFFRTLSQVERRGDRTAQKISRRFMRVGRNLQFLGQDLTRFVTLPLAAVGGLSARAAVQFESSFAGIRKTVNATEEEFANLERKIRDLAAGPDAIPIDVNLNRIGEAAGQLGVGADNLVNFIRVIGELGASTVLAGEEAAIGFARFAKITETPIEKIRDLGNVIVDLGNNFEANEREILDFALRLGGAGTTAGLAASEILALGAALAAVGLPAEAGGTAFSRVIVQMAQAAEQGGAELEKFARVAGTTADKFAESFREAPAEALQQFIEGLAGAEERGESLFGTIEDLFGENVRIRDALLRAATASDSFRDALVRQNTALSEGTALQDEANKRFDTAESRLKILRQRLNDRAIDLGNKLIPSVIKAGEVLVGLSRIFTSLPDPILSTVIAVAALGAAIGPVALVIGNLTTGFARLIPLANTTTGAFKNLTLVPAALKADFTAAAGAAGTLTTALIALAAVGGFQLGKLIDEFFGISEKIQQGLAARTPIEEEVRRLVGDPKELGNVLREIKSAQNAALLAGQVEPGDELLRDATLRGKRLTEAEITDALKLRDALRELTRERVLGAQAQRDAAAAAETDAALKKAANVQTDEQREAVEELIAALTRQKAQLELGADSLEFYLLGLENVTDEQKNELAQVLEAIKARRESNAELERENALRESNARTIAGTVERLETELSRLRGFSDAALEIARLSALAETPEDFANVEKIKVLFEEIRLLEERNEKQQRADEILRESLTLDQQKILALAELARLHKENFLSADEHALAVQNLEKHYEALAKRAKKTGTDLDDLGKRATSQLRSAFAGLFSDVDQGFAQMVRGFADALNRMLADLAASQLLSFITGLFGANAQARSTFASLTPAQVIGLTNLRGGGPVDPSIRRFQGGGDAQVFPKGLIDGPGTGTSDSILARISKGEFVLREAAVRALGVPFLEKLNNLELPGLNMIDAAQRRFAAGGFAGGPSLAGAGAGGDVFNFNMSVDARGAAPGVGVEIEKAIAAAEPRLMKRAVHEVAQARLRGGRIARVFDG